MQEKRVREDEEESDSGASDQNEHNSKAVKDRSCPFCHQAFTSSSLGRHLDLYIKPNKPKAPDGIHKVDEIRRLRGGITRRSAKGAKKAKLKDDSTERDESEGVERAKEDNESGKELVQTNGRSFVNGMDWRTTGVINDIGGQRRLMWKDAEDSTPKSDTPKTIELEKSAPNKSSGTEWREVPSFEEQVETGRAAEMALREVLASIAAAKEEQDDLSLFNGVDVFALSFPAVCLALLPSPGALYSATPFSDDDSWSIDPPAERQHSALEKWINDQQVTRRNAAVVAKFKRHINAGFGYWSRLSKEEQDRTWRVETLRAFSTAQQATDKLRAQLKACKQRIAHLENEYELLSSCQLPREKLLHPPKTIPIPSSTAASENGAVNMTADELIERWRATVRTVAKPKKQRSDTAHTTSFPPPVLRSEDTYTASILAGDRKWNGKPGMSRLSDDMVMHGAVHGIGGPMNLDDRERFPGQDGTYDAPGLPRTSSDQAQENG